MTRQESFKRRVRQRMAKTGERYTAARMALLDATAGPGPSTSPEWAAPPEMSDEAIRAATGRGHDEWRAIIEAAPVDPTDHAAVANHLEQHHDINGWWAQAVTVSYERIAGLRLPYQRSDGTFTVSKTRTVGVDPELLRKLLLSDDHRIDLFPGHTTWLRSKPTTKTLRVGIGPGQAVARFGIDDLGGGRCRVSIQHDRLPTHDSVEEWKHYWSEWFDAIDAAGA